MYFDFLEREAESIAAFRDVQRSAFAAERAAWQAAGELDRKPDPVASAPSGRPAGEPLPPGTVVRAPLASSVWRVDVEPGDVVRSGERLATLEAMKTEIPVEAPHAGTVLAVLVRPGQLVTSGADIFVVGEAS